MKIGEILRQPPSKSQVKELETLGFELADTIRSTRLELLKKRNQMLHPKDKELTELDRKVMLDASVAMLESDYDFLLRLEVLIKERLANIKWLM